MSDVNTQNDALKELVKQVEKLNFIVNQLNKTHNHDNMFRFLSKNARNELLAGIMETSGAVEDAAKATYRSMKRVKRERLPEEVADLMLVNRRDDALAFMPTVTRTPTSSITASSFPDD